MLLNDFLSQSAQQYPDKTAIINLERRISYEQLNDMANSLANGLIASGLTRHDRAAIYLDNSIESVVALFGILKAGGVYLIINPQVKSKKLSYILNDCQVKCVITDNAGIVQFLENHVTVPGLRFVLLADYGQFGVAGQPERLPDTAAAPFAVTTLSDFIAAYPAVEPPKRAIDIDLASLMYTSGSTGEPKGVMLTHLNMVTAANSIVHYLENRSDDIILNYLPLSFDYGLYQVLMSVRFGGTVVLEKSFVYPYQAVQTIIRERVTGFPIVPAMVALLLQLKDLNQYDFSHVRYLTNTGQALPPAHIAELRSVFSSARIFSMYGLTECKRVSYLPPDEIDRRPLSVGKAIPNTEVWLIDEAGDRISEPHKVGELVIRGAHVMKGYWNKPDETEAVLKPGVYPDEHVLLSRDYFRMDEEGFLYFVSRKDDVIKSGGERISPREVEDTLYEMPGVSEAAVIGVPDEILGYALKAFVAFREGSARSAAADIIAFCAERLEHSRVPKYVELRDVLPKSSSGKIRKRDLTP